MGRICRAYIIVKRKRREQYRYREKDRVTVQPLGRRSLVQTPTEATVL
jgi:hypothetical protein